MGGPKKVGARRDLATRSPDPLAAHSSPQLDAQPEHAGVTAAALTIQRSAGNQATRRALDRARESRITAVLPADHPGERAADRLAADALAARPPRATAALSTARPRGGGRPLAPALRRDMSGAFGVDFTAVRVHDDERADGMSRSIDALAFTTGPDIYFRRGAFDPAGAAGRGLLAHELAHVVHQARTPAAAPVIQRYTIVDSRKDIDSVEWTAEHTFVHQARGEALDDFLVSPTADTARIASHNGEAGVSLRVSDDLQLAVEELGPANLKQAKAYYSTAERVADSNEKLAAVGSPFEMLPQEAEALTLTTPDGSETLVKVLPRNKVTPKGTQRTPSPDEAEVSEGLGMFARQQCIELAEQITGRAQGGKEAYLKLDDGQGDDLDGMRHLLETVPLRGVRTDANSGYIRNFIEDLDALAENPLAAAIVRDIRPLFVELKQCLASDATPSDALRIMLAEYMAVDTANEIPELAKVGVLAASDPNIARVHETVRQFAIYDRLKQLEQASESGEQEEARADVMDALGIDEYASPEVGEAYRIKYLGGITGEWNYHWAGVVARSGLDTVTLENYTRDQRSAADAGRFHDARWYFAMYGTEEQSFHHDYATPSGLAMTGVYATRAQQAKEVAPQDPDLARSRDLGTRLATMRRDLIKDSAGRSTNAHYLTILRLLGECAALAIEAAEDPKKYKDLVDLGDQISVTIDAATSSKRDVRDARNQALEAMRVALVAVKREAFTAFLASG
ncbi:MAG: DUF4157 domain-containing protein [Nannocystis sp.]|nr:DUF4157 domain-containing protein [Nannocystis sp.]